jgi:hypothetical protein
MRQLFVNGLAGTLSASSTALFRACQVLTFDIV